MCFRGKRILFWLNHYYLEIPLHPSLIHQVGHLLRLPRLNRANHPLRGGPVISTLECPKELTRTGSVLACAQLVLLPGDGAALSGPRPLTSITSQDSFSETWPQASLIETVLQLKFFPAQKTLDSCRLDNKT